MHRCKRGCNSTALINDLLRCKREWQSVALGSILHTVLRCGLSVEGPYPVRTAVLDCTIEGPKDPSGNYSREVAWWRGGEPGSGCGYVRGVVASMSVNGVCWRARRRVRWVAAGWQWWRGRRV